MDTRTVELENGDTVEIEVDWVTLMQIAHETVSTSTDLSNKETMLLSHQELFTLFVETMEEIKEYTERDG